MNKEDIENLVNTDFDKMEIIINRIYKENYVRKLEQENEQLKKELQKADSLTQSCIFEGKEESELNFRKAINIIKELRSWLEETIPNTMDTMKRIAFIDVLSKLNELEGDKNDNNT